MRYASVSRGVRGPPVTGLTFKEASCASESSARLVSLSTRSGRRPVRGLFDRTEIGGSTVLATSCAATRANRRRNEQEGDRRLRPSARLAIPRIRSTFRRRSHARREIRLSARRGKFKNEKPEFGPAEVRTFAEQ